MEQLSKKQLRRQRREEEKQKQRGRQTNHRVRNRILLWGGVIVVIAAAIFGMVKLIQNSGSTTSATLKNDQIYPTDWVKGNESAKVVLIEYADFQCPACASYAPWVEQLQKELGDKFRLVYRYFPLDSIHRNARAAAYAAEAAGRQGKFWEMSKKLFEEQTSWENLADPQETFIKYAQDLGLNTTTFESTMDLKEVKDKVEEQYQSGIEANVQHTPTFFLNGKEIQNPRSYNELKAYIQSS